MSTTTRTRRTKGAPATVTNTDSSLRDKLMASGELNGDSSYPENTTPNLPFMRTAPKRGRIPKIVDHTDDQLDEAVEEAREKYGPHFWIMLHGIDAFMERRRRKEGGGERARILAEIDALEASLTDLKRRAHKYA